MASPPAPPRTSRSGTIISSLRAMVLPFLMVLFPALWFVNRNVASNVLPPDLEPTTTLIAGSILLSVLGSAVVAAIVAVVLRGLVPEAEASNGERTRLRQLVYPDDRTLRVLAALLVVVFAWAAVALVGVGPGWLEYAFYPLMAVVGLPFLVLAPLAIGSWVWVVLGLALSAVWLFVLSVAIGDLSRGTVGFVAGRE